MALWVALACALVSATGCSGPAGPAPKGLGEAGKPAEWVSFTLQATPYRPGPPAVDTGGPTADLVAQPAEVPYRVPRGYLQHPVEPGESPVVVSFQALAPGWEPIPYRTSSLSIEFPEPGTEGPVAVVFSLRRGGADDPPDEIAFQNLTRFDAPIPAEAGPAGFERYTVGAPTPQSHLYRKRTTDHLLVVVCSLPTPVTTGPALCSNHSRLESGTVLMYRFTEDRLPEIEAIDSGIRRLIRGFQQPPVSP